jgi:hypothetical protein
VKSFHVGDNVIVNKSIVRLDANGQQSVYAVEGETGRVKKIFRAESSKHKTYLSAQVLTSAGIKTLRLTSLKHVKQ